MSDFSEDSEDVISMQFKMRKAMYPVLYIVFGVATLVAVFFFSKNPMKALLTKLVVVLGILQFVSYFLDLASEHIQRAVAFPQLRTHKLHIMLTIG
jgi:hypothetical protein